MIEFSYAFQWPSGDEEGTILTKKKVIWYIIFDDNSDSAEMEFSHIDRIEQLREGGFAEESQYRVWGNDSAKWEYLSPSLSRENNGDEKLIELLTRYINEAQAAAK